MPAGRLLRTIGVAVGLAAGIAAAQDAPPTKDPPPAGPQEPPAAGPAPPAPPSFTPPAILAQRRKGLRHSGSDTAVAAGLDWLLRHQWTDGRWDCDLFLGRCSGARCQGPGMSFFDPGVTALATLALLGAGRTHREGADAPAVAKALEYLTVIQDSEGCIGPRTSSHFMYNHAAATTAVAEALWLTGDETLLGPATKARDFLVAARNPYLGWRYGVRDGDNDTSATVYALIALRTCEFARLDVRREAYVDGDAWLDKMGDPSDGRVGYQSRGGSDARVEVRETKGTREDGPEVVLPDGTRIRIPLANTSGLRTRAPAPSSPLFRGEDEVDPRFPGSPWSALTAGATFATSVTGGPERAARVERGAKFVSDHPPRFDPSPEGRVLDLHCLLFGSLLHGQRPLPTKKPDGAAEDWRPFRDGAVADLLATQRKKPDGCAAGSWDPDLDPFGSVGGRVYSTSMALLALQAPNRFPRVWDPKAKPPKPGKR